MSELRDASPLADGPVIEAKDLRVWYATDRGPVRAVDGVTLLAPTGRDPRASSGSPAAASRPWGGA